jgi:hypothetical protein
MVMLVLLLLYRFVKVSSMARAVNYFRIPLNVKRIFPVTPYNTSMPESNPAVDPAQDPTMQPLQHVIETLGGQAAPAHIVEGVGAAAVSEVVHERPKPQRWDELVEFASTLPIFKKVDKYGATYVPESVDVLRGKLQELLDDEALDTHRYYGMGTLLCGVARGLRDPEQRTTAVKSMGDRLSTHWRLGGTTGRGTLTIGDIRGAPLGTTFSTMVKDEAARFPPHIGLLNDVLSWHAAEREVALMRGDPTADVSFISKKGGRNGEYQAGKAVERIIDATATATARTLRHVLTLRAEHLRKIDPDFPETPTIIEVLERTDMDDINLVPVAQRAAAMRLDEMQTLEVNQIITLDDEGRAVFHGKKLPRSRDLQPPEVKHKDGRVSRPILHTSRLRCPALFIDGLIPDMVSCITEALYEADELAARMNRLLRRGSN